MSQQLTQEAAALIEDLLRDLKRATTALDEAIETVKTLKKENADLIKLVEGSQSLAGRALNERR